MKLFAVTCVLTLFFSSAHSQESEEISSNEAYLQAIAEVTEDYHGATAYLGSRHAYEAIREKLRRILVLGEKTAPEKISPDLRRAVFYARTLDLLVLTIANSLEKPLSGEKLHPMPELPEFVEQHIALDPQFAEEMGFHEVISNTRGGGVFAWKDYGNNRAHIRPHDLWTYAYNEAPDVPHSLENQKQTNPFWQFHNVAAGFPSASDDFPALWKKMETRQGKDLARLSDGPFEIPLESLSGTFAMRFTVQRELTEPLIIKLEVSEGALGLELGAIKAAAWENGNDGISNGDIHLPADLSDHTEIFFVTRTDIPGFEKFTKPSSGVLHVGTK